VTPAAFGWDDETRREAGMTLRYRLMGEDQDWLRRFASGLDTMAPRIGSENAAGMISMASRFGCEAWVAAPPPSSRPSLHTRQAPHPGPLASGEREDPWCMQMRHPTGARTRAPRGAGG
jgi:hypothetical protein